MQNSNSRFRNLTIALAGVTQAIDVMDKLARTGYLNSSPFATSVNSLFEQNPSDAEAVFDGAGNLERGLEVLVDLLKHRRSKEHTTIIGYCLGIFHLQRKLYKNKAMLSAVGKRLEQARHQVQHFGVAHENVIANLASIYSETISTFPFRIQVVGEYQYLQQQRVADQVRVLLLSAVRAATLWRQVGGSRWQLLLHRARILSTAEDLLQQIRAERRN